MKRQPIVLDSKILADEIFIKNDEASFNLRLKPSLLKKISAELSKMLRK